MATVKLYLDARHLSGEMASLKLCVSHNRDRSYVSLGIMLLPEQWLPDLERVVHHKNADRMNRQIMRIKLDAEDRIYEYDKCNKNSRLTAKDYKDIAMGKEPRCDMESLFYPRFVQFSNRKRGRTHEIYEATLSKIVAFDKKIKNRSFAEIDRKWLVKFDEFLTTTSPSANARNIHHRNIRAVFNDAIDDEVTSCYPFRRFKLKYEPTRKRAMTAEDLRRFFDAPVVEYEKRYLDIFKLMFLLIGINSVDLANLKKSDYVNGRIEYTRAKTHQLYSVAIVPEAAEIIERYQGKGDYLLDIMDKVSDYRHFAYHMNNALKEIGGTKLEGRGGKKTTSPMFPFVTTYYARHSWATIAASLDIPKETISRSLGHKSAYSSVTDIYIDFDMKKVDEANRRVIDYVLYNKV